MTKVIVKNSDITLSTKLKVAKKFLDRLVGLMFKKEMVGYDSLLIKKCNSIHTFFMFFPIDVIFLDKNFVVIKVIRSMKPWRMTRMYFTATQTLELEGGSVTDDLRTGDQLEVICTN